VKTPTYSSPPVEHFTTNSENFHPRVTTFIYHSETLTAECELSLNTLKTLTQCSEKLRTLTQCGYNSHPPKYPK